MSDNTKPIFYTDKDVQAKHQALFQGSTRRGVGEILAPGISKPVFESALRAFRDIVGADGVHTGAALINYVDPFELWEDTGRRHVPSAAVWCAASNPMNYRRQ